MSVLCLVLRGHSGLWTCGFGLCTHGLPGNKASGVSHLSSVQFCCNNNNFISFR